MLQAQVGTDSKRSELHKASSTEFAFSLLARQRTSCDKVAKPIMNPSQECQSTDMKEESTEEDGSFG